MKAFRALISGIVFPTLFLPVLLCLASFLSKPLIYQVPFLHWLPLIWGVWNILYVFILKKWMPIAVAGGILGLLVALYGVFWLHIPEMLRIESIRYLPLIGAPLLYALLWRYVVEPTNKMLGL